jgi:prepilin-type N-terminal cleavage/methylation domain-containing protein
MYRHTLQKNTGFTLIETMVAIFILTLALSALLTLTSNSTFSARYARNEITANYLAQEVADYIRNDRDNIVFNQKGGWTNFLNTYGYTGSNACFSASGCYFEPANMLSFPQTVCPGGVCPYFNYDETATFNDFYTYRTPGTIVKSIFTRKVLMSVPAANPDELDVTIRLDWLNGNLPRSRTLQITLLNWQK